MNDEEESEAEQTKVSLSALAPAAHYGRLPASLHVFLECLDDSREIHEIKSVPVMIGRGRHATLRLSDQKLSRLHATIAWENDEFRIIDNNSGNGTRLNGSRVGDYRLVDGDILEVGATKLRFHVERAS